jgi:hypothetical protein
VTPTTGGFAMSEFLRVLLEFIQFLWPMRRVEQWEKAGYYVFGRWVRPVGPGIWPIVPWFCDVRAVSVAEAIVGTGRLDITLSDKTLLSFTATATVRVVDVYAALNLVDQHTETMQELLASVLAERLASVDSARLEPEGRGRLYADLRRWVAEEASEYGIEVTKVRFTSFIMNTRSHRLIIDQNQIASW